MIGDTETVNNLRGSLLYMAPEMLIRRQYNEKADLWSVGVILYGMHHFIFLFISCIILYQWTVRKRVVHNYASLLYQLLSRVLIFGF